MRQICFARTRFCCIRDATSSGAHLVAVLVIGLEIFEKTMGKSAFRFIWEFNFVNH